MRVPTAKEFFFATAPADARTREERERAFFHAIRTRNGTNKTTCAHRLDSVNDVVNGVLPADRPLDIMDVGVSSGITTLEWMESLESAGIEYRMTAGDLCVKASLLSFTRWLNILVDRAGYPLQFDLGGRAIPYPRGVRRSLLCPPLLQLVEAFRWRLPRLMSSGRNRAIDVLLITPELKNRSVEVVEDDILVPGRFRNRFDVVRAANVLNNLYFDDETLTAMAVNLCARLKQGGLLVVCRTDEHQINHGTVFQLYRTDRLEVVCRIGERSDIERLVIAGVNRSPVTP